VGKLRTSRPKGAEAVVFVYCTPEQKEALQAAAAKLVAAVPGAKLPLYRFLLEAGLKEAERVLGAKIDRADPKPAKR
jgi:hypothetical protein